jgi:hypothetical protein
MNLDYDTIHGQKVTSIVGRNCRSGDDGKIACEEVAIYLPTSVATISVVADTDEIVLRLRKDITSLMSGTRGWEALNQFDEYLGAELGWYWVGKNYRGYEDTIILSFAGVEPQIAMCGVASFLWLYRMQRV